MQIITCEIEEDVYVLIPRHLRKQIVIKGVDVENYDYSDDEVWKSLKKESTKSYKKLKEREFNLRNN